MKPVDRAISRAMKSTTHKEYYFHIKAGMEMQHGRYITECKAGTVFVREERPGEWYASVARCSEWDNFCKRIGRSQARRKYFQGRHNIPVSVEGRPTYALAESVYFNEHQN